MPNHNLFTSLIISIICFSFPTRVKGQSPPTYFIEKDSANRMIRSYLTSTNDSGNAPDLRSLIFNADAMRKYLTDSTIKEVKLMLAHTLQYINEGNEGKPAGYTSNALTIIMAGYDNAGNYIYYNTGFILNRARPCPPLCPPTGTALSPTLP